MGEHEFIASAAFGMEAIVVRELRALGYEGATVDDGRVRFKADLSAICRANLWLRCAERVQVVVADFPARDFDELFDQVKVLPWEEWLPVDAKFPVAARCVRSQIRSLPNTQKMVKRAIVERLRTVYSRHWFEESGNLYNIEASIVGNRALLTIDTSGDGLHKRGYRRLVGQAPLRETVAAALVQLSYWNRDRLLVDPFCGSGTIPIEAALIGRNLAPGRNRHFTAETWKQLPQQLWAAARQEVKDLEDRRPLTIPIVGTDRDPSAIKMARQHARQAGVETEIHFDCKEFVAFPTNRNAGVLICNPPYGERLGEEKELRQLYADMGELLLPLDDWSLYILTAREGFERDFGRRADRRRKLYNARIACTYYQYLGPRPVGTDAVETPSEEIPESADEPASSSPLPPSVESEERPSPVPASESRPEPETNPWLRNRPRKPMSESTISERTDEPVNPPPTERPAAETKPVVEFESPRFGPWRKRVTSDADDAGQNAGSEGEKSAGAEVSAPRDSQRQADPIVTAEPPVYRGPVASEQPTSSPAEIPATSLPVPSEPDSSSSITPAVASADVAISEGPQPDAAVPSPDAHSSGEAPLAGEATGESASEAAAPPTLPPKAPHPWKKNPWAR